MVGEQVSNAPEKISVFERITEWCVYVIDLTHYPGVFLLMALESMIAPIPSGVR